MNSYESRWFNPAAICEFGLQEFSFDQDDQLEKMTKPRTCDEFISRKLGFGSKEYSEMQIVERFQAKNREWQESVEKNMSDDTETT